MSRGAKEKWKRKPSTPSRGMGAFKTGGAAEVSRSAAVGGRAPSRCCVTNDITFLVANEEYVLNGRLFALFWPCGSILWLIHLITSFFHQNWVTFFKIRAWNVQGEGKKVSKTYNKTSKPSRRFNFPIGTTALTDPTLFISREHMWRKSLSRPR